MFKLFSARFQLVKGFVKYLCVIWHYFLIIFYSE